MSKAFKFNLSDRVMVPGLVNAQGVIHSRTERTNNEPDYSLLYLDAEGATLGCNHPESAISAAQPEVLTFNVVEAARPAPKANKKKPARKSRRK